MWTIDQIMNRDPYCVGLDTPLEQCAALMRRHDIRHLVVLTAVGHVAGCIGAAAVAGASREKGIGVPHIIEPVDVRVGAKTPVREVLQGLIASAWDLAVVVDRGRGAIGIVTEHDMVGLATVMLPADALSSLNSTGPVITTREDDPAGHALKQMIAHGLRHLVVVDDDGTLAGVLSWRDLVRAGVTEDESQTVAYFLAPGPVHYVMREQSLRVAAQRMFTAKIGALPIVDEHHRPVWILTRTDVMRGMHNLLDRAERSVEETMEHAVGT
jgi:CBS domain-containing protein